ncbi:MAG: uracil phosphoribosyltransferase [Selenomonadaceae bacterium]|nr:uracil phosphoribosyltransferase [Selenomonadaceae bacterium]
MIQEIFHPILKDRLTLMRRKETPAKDFRQAVEEIATFMIYEVAKNFKLQEIEIETPITKCKAKILAEEFGIVPILRAGLGMVSGALKVLPNAAVGHIGLVRDETTHKPIEYYKKLPPNISSKKIIVVDPMLATGGSSSAALQMLKDAGAKDIVFVCIIAAPEGIKKISGDHPEIPIYTAAVDESLNENAYIVPGLGDAGDRIFDTL